MIVLKRDRPLFVTRFAYSPLWETLAAVRCVLYPDKHSLHARWAARHVELGDSLGVLRDLLPRSGWSPDFLAPPPSCDAATSLDAQLEAVLATPEEIVVREVSLVRTSEVGTQRLMTALEQPATLLSDVVEVVQRCYDELDRVAESVTQADVAGYAFSITHLSGIESDQRRTDAAGSLMQAIFNRCCAHRRPRSLSPGEAEWVGTSDLRQRRNLRQRYGNTSSGR